MCDLKCYTVFLPAADQTVMKHMPKFYLLVFVYLEIFGFDPWNFHFFFFFSSKFSPGLSVDFVPDIIAIYAILLLHCVSA